MSSSLNSVSHTVRGGGGGLRREKKIIGRQCDYNWHTVDNVLC